MRSTKGFFVFACAAGLLGLLAFSMSGFAAKGGIPGPPTGGEVGNNLSLPAVSTESVNSVAVYWNTPETDILGEHYSYGCDQEESSGQFSYPNTSCVDSLDAPTTYYTAASCTSAGYPCEGLPVERIYWQKVDVNEWWADEDGISPNAEYVDYVDWGDALEAVSWSERSVVRVETQPYSSTIAGFDPSAMSCLEAANAASLVATDVCKIGFKMWHVSGQGITEHWGVRAIDADAAVSYNYDSPFQIINTSTAWLNVTKLVPDTAMCPEPGGNPNDPPPPGPFTWNQAGGFWEGTCEVHDNPYSVEVSVGGKYVYGYNLRMTNVPTEPCAGWAKTGYYRLTFYDPLLNVNFDDPDAPNVAPPAVPSVIRALPRNGNFNTVLAPPAPVVVTEEEDPTEDDRLFKPVVDTVNNLTYIDICIVPKPQGGGGGGNGGKGGSGVGGGIGGGRSDNRGNH
jgi:hypothetical protein